MFLFEFVITELDATHEEIQKLLNEKRELASDAQRAKELVQRCETLEKELEAAKVVCALSV